MTSITNGSYGSRLVLCDSSFVSCWLNWRGWLSTVLKIGILVKLDESLDGDGHWGWWCYGAARTWPRATLTSQCEHVSRTSWRVLQSDHVTVNNQSVRRASNVSSTANGEHFRDMRMRSGSDIMSRCTSCKPIRIHQELTRFVLIHENTIFVKTWPGI